MNPSGELAPTPFTDNCQLGAWDCLEQITSYFYGQKDRSEDDMLYYEQWKKFRDEFPRKDNDLAHYDWARKHKGNKEKWHVPFADHFASNTFKAYDDLGRDSLLNGGLTSRIELLPKAITMPCVQRKGTVRKGTATDVYPRSFRDPNMGQVLRLERNKEAGYTSQLYITNKRSLDVATGNTDGALQVARAPKRQKANAPIINKRLNAKDKATLVYKNLPPWQQEDGDAIVDLAPPRPNARGRKRKGN